MSDKFGETKHYQGASQSTRSILKVLGVREDQLDGECVKALDTLSDPEWMLTHAAKYLWRCEQKGYYQRDLGKAQNWVQRYLEFRPYSVRASEAVRLIDELSATEPNLTLPRFGKAWINKKKGTAYVPLYFAWHSEAPEAVVFYSLSKGRFRDWLAASLFKLITVVMGKDRFWVRPVELWNEKFRPKDDTDLRT